MKWGDWIEHDGKGCPCVGMYVETIEHDGFKWSGIAGTEGGESWHWGNYPEYSKVIRYRIRKPLGMTVLQEIVMNPERELEEV